MRLSTLNTIHHTIFCILYHTCLIHQYSINIYHRRNQALISGLEVTSIDRDISCGVAHPAGEVVALLDALLLLVLGRCHIQLRAAHWTPTLLR